MTVRSAHHHIGLVVAVVDREAKDPERLPTSVQMKGTPMKSNLRRMFSRYRTRRRLDRVCALVVRPSARRPHR